MKSWKDTLKGWVRSTEFYRKNNLIFREFRHFSTPFLLGIFFAVSASLLEAATIGFLLKFLRALSDQEAESTLGVSLFDQLLFGVFGENSSTHSKIIWGSIIIILATLARSSFMYLGNRNLINAQIHLLERIRFRIFDQLASLHLSFFTKSRSGDLVNLMTTEVDNLKNGTQAIATLISKGIYVPLYLVLLATVSLQLAILATIFLSLIPLVLVYIRKQVRLASVEVTQINKLIASLTFEFVTGIQTIQAFSSQDFERKRLTKAVDSMSSALDRQNAWRSLTDPANEFLGFSVIVFLIAFSNLSLKLPVSSIITFVYILLRLVQSLRQINLSIVAISQLYGSARSIEEFLRSKDKSFINSGLITFKGLKSAIEFKNVTFAYPNHEAVIRKINIKFPKGSTCAIVGSSGSGKSTLANLLLRLYDPTEGAILVDGQDIRSFDLASFHSKIAVVSQDTFLFNASVRENIAYGLDAVSEEDLRSAAKLAHALEFIEVLPDGFDTLLGDRGVRLSGGQRQRIAIARAILRDPEVLILDEATSALDNEAERIVQAAITAASKNRTVVMIAHRLSTVRHADQVAVLHSGAIIEQGTYDELIERRGLLWKLEHAAVS